MGLVQWLRHLVLHAITVLKPAEIALQSLSPSGELRVRSGNSKIHNPEMEIVRIACRRRTRQLEAPHLLLHSGFCQDRVGYVKGSRTGIVVVILPWKRATKGRMRVIARPV